MGQSLFIQIYVSKIQIIQCGRRGARGSQEGIEQQGLVVFSPKNPLTVFLFVCCLREQKKNVVPYPTLWRIFHDYRVFRLRFQLAQFSHKYSCLKKHHHSYQIRSDSSLLTSALFDSFFINLITKHGLWTPQRETSLRLLRLIKCWFFCYAVDTHVYSSNVSIPI